ncbi:MAG: D-glycero-beta-D-manno-heptose 1-phosphate adenylyltransferase [Bacteroidota bacterium]
MTSLEKIKNKIYTPESLRLKLGEWRFRDRKIVFTNGCFDLLHLGHIDYLGKAADLGDMLIIGVNTDQSVQKLKGQNRPINNEEQRTHLLASLLFVDAVILFDEETPFDLIKIIQPDVLVKGGDYTPDKVVGADLVTANGGFVHIIPLLAGYSTTLTEEKIKNSIKR